MITVGETQTYYTKSRKLFTEDEQKGVIDYLAVHPKAGTLIRETGGIRKLRWGRDGKGKSGGVRVIYYFHSEDLPLYLLTLFSKGDKENLSKAERNDLAKLVKILKQCWIGDEDE